MITKPVITRPVTTTPVVGGDVLSRSNDSAAPTGGSSPLNTLRAAGERARQDLGGAATEASAFNAFSPGTSTDETPYAQIILNRAMENLSGPNSQTSRHFMIRAKLAEQLGNEEYRRNRMIGELADMALRKEASDADISQKWINYKLQERQLEEQQAHNIEAEQNYRDQIQARAQSYDANAQAKIAAEEAKTAREDRKNMMGFVGDYVKQQLATNPDADRNALIQQGTKLWNDMQASMSPQQGSAISPVGMVPPTGGVTGALAAGVQNGITAMANAPIIQRPLAPMQQVQQPPMTYDQNTPEGYVPERPGFMSMSAPGRERATTENPLSAAFRPIVRQNIGNRATQSRTMEPTKPQEETIKGLGIPRGSRIVGYYADGTQKWQAPDGTIYGVAQ